MTIALTFDAVGWREAEAQIGLAQIVLEGLAVGLRQGLHGERDLADGVRKVHEVLVAAVAAMDPPGRRDRTVRDGDCFLLAHVSPPVVGLSTPTVGAPVASPPEDGATGT